MADDKSPLIAPRPYHSFLLRCWPDQGSNQWCFELQSIATEPVKIQRGSAELHTLPDFMRHALKKKRGSELTQVKSEE